MTTEVLIVDDSLTVRMDLAEAFTAAGLHAVLCQSLAEARQAIAQRPIALAVLDVLLPDGDGIELLREIRALPALAQIPILMLSSEAEIGDRVRGLGGGANDYVGKPYDRDAVVARVRALLPRPVQAQTAEQRATILVVDDSLTFRSELAGALEAAGYAVLMALDGEEGLRLAALHRPTAAVIDSVLPGIDGGTVIRSIRLDAALRGTPCLLLTGSDDRGAELRALDAGADAFVRKEESLDVVLARLAAMLRMSSSAERSETASLLAPKRILAVDDSLTYLQELAAALGAEGYDVIRAHSGEAAIELLAVQSVDCILLDLVMPGMDGRETCRRIKASPGIRQIPLIMVSAREERATMVDGLSAGAEDFISKSSSFEVLHARIRVQIRRKQFEDEHRSVQEELRRSELDASEARAARNIAEAKAAHADALERKNRELRALAEKLEQKNLELDAFSYSVSHDLRAPLRSIDGFSQIVLEEHGHALDADGRSCLERVRTAALQMSALIDALLGLARLQHADLRREAFDLGELAAPIVDELRRHSSGRAVEVLIADGLAVHADRALVAIVLENLLGNAWKFTARAGVPRIEVGREREGERPFFVRDNGAGFDVAYAGKLFTPFQRLHSVREFEGTGIGLATVQRIISRHGGRIWAQAKPGAGAAFYFTLGAELA